MKVKVGKSIKFGQEFHYYEIESDDIPYANLQQTKELLEKYLTGWVNDYAKVNGNDNGKPEPHSGYCVHCGAKIDLKYVQCYECWKRHQVR
jgi:hypothetical protein